MFIIKNFYDIRYLEKFEKTTCENVGLHFNMIGS